jgi:hypothetical protein
MISASWTQCTFASRKSSRFWDEAREIFHHDMEDLIAVLDGRAELVSEINQAPAEVRNFVAEQIRDWLRDETFLESLNGHLRGDAASQARKPILMDRLRHLVDKLG